MLAAFAEAADVGSRSEVGVAASQADEFGESQSGLGRHEEQAVVASAGPAAQVGRGDHGVDLGLGQERDHRRFAALGWDGEDAGDELGVFGVAIGGEAVEGVDGGEAGVARADAVVTVMFEMVEEPADHVGVEVGEVELGGRLGGSGVGVGEQEPEPVPVGLHGALTGPALLGEAGGEEALQRRGERAHRSALCWPARRAANAISSGVADKYQ